MLDVKQDFTMLYHLSKKIIVPYMIFC